MGRRMVFKSMARDAAARPLQETAPAAHLEATVTGVHFAGLHTLRVPSVFRCTFMIFLVKMSLQTRGFGRTIRWLRTHMQAIPEVASADPEAIKATEYTVAMAGAFYPGRALCLEQSLVLYYALRRQGAPVRFAMGVQAHPFAAHAWVEYQHEPINDVPEHIKRFARLPGELP